MVCLSFLLWVSKAKLRCVWLHTLTHINEKIYFRNWLTWSRRLRNPTICSLEPENQESLWYNPVQLQRPENPGSWWCKSDNNWKAKEQGAVMSEGKRRWMSRSNRERELALPLPFILLGPSVGWMVPTHVGENGLLYSVHQFKCWSLPETPSQAHPEMFYQLPGHS